MRGVSAKFKHHRDVVALPYEPSLNECFYIGYCAWLHCSIQYRPRPLLLKRCVAQTGTFGPRTSGAPTFAAKSHYYTKYSSFYLWTSKQILHKVTKKNHCDCRNVRTFSTRSISFRTKSITGRPPEILYRAHICVCACMSPKEFSRETICCFFNYYIFILSHWT